MGLDSGYGIGSLKPGVCTSTTRPAAPFDGQVIYETDTNKAMVYQGSSWVVLSTDSAYKPGLVFIGSTTLSSTSTTISNVFSSTYSTYILRGDGVVTSSADDNHFYLTGINSSGYTSGRRYYAYSTGTGTDQQSANNAAASGPFIYIDADTVSSFEIKISNPYQASYKHWFAQGSSSSYQMTAWGKIASNTQASGITIYNGGTYTAGIVSVYGMVV